MRQSKLNKIIAFLLTCIFLIALSTGAVAKKKRSGGIIRLEETVIEGRVQKPNAFFINTRQSLVYESMELKEDFVKEIIKVVEDGTF